MKLVFMKKLTKQVAEQNIEGIEAWFKANPRKQVCRTDIFGKIRRGQVREEILKHAEV